MSLRVRDASASKNLPHIKSNCIFDVGVHHTGFMFQNLSCVLWFNPLWKEPRLNSPQPWNMPPTKVPLNWQILELKYSNFSKYSLIQISLCCSSFGNLYFHLFLYFLGDYSQCNGLWKPLSGVATENDWVSDPAMCKPGYYVFHLVRFSNWLESLLRSVGWGTWLYSTLLLPPRIWDSSSVTKNTD